MTWRWVSIQALTLLHAESLAVHGGESGVRDAGLLESVMARPQNLVADGSPDLADLAAAYAVGLARNHPFLDGNKRTAFLAIGLFVGLNGRRLDTTQVEATAAMLDLAAGEFDEPQLAAWIRGRLVDR